VATELGVSAGGIEVVACKDHALVCARTAGLEVNGGSAVTHPTRLDDDIISRTLKLNSRARVRSRREIKDAALDYNVPNAIDAFTKEADAIAASVPEVAVNHFHTTGLSLSRGPAVVEADQVLVLVFGDEFTREFQVLEGDVLAAIPDIKQSTIPNSGTRQHNVGRTTFTTD
jgi:hypothetical protein